MLGLFVTAPATLLHARSAHMAVVVGEYLYILGGIRGSTFSPPWVTQTERAPINPDGSLGAFEPYPTADLVTPRWSANAIVSADAVYVMGGAGSDYFASVERAPINPDGSLGSFVTTTRSLGERGMEQGLLTTAGRAYLMGGYDTTTRSSVQAAPYDGSSLGEWGVLPATPLLSARQGIAVIRTSGWAYVAGGVVDNTSGAFLSIVDRAPLAPDGSLGAFGSSGVTLTTPRHGASVLQAGNSVYVIAGKGTQTTSLASVDHATVDATGALGPFELDTPALAVARSGHTGTLVHGTHYYVIGGLVDGIYGASEASVELALVR